MSNPSYKLVVVAAVVERGIPIVSISGASILIIALIVSRVPTDQFVYIGSFRRKGEKNHLLGKEAITKLAQIT